MNKWMDGRKEWREGRGEEEREKGKRGRRRREGGMDAVKDSWRDGWKVSPGCKLRRYKNWV